MWARVTSRKLHGKITTSRVLITSLMVDVLDFFMNIAIAILTGSIVMLVEAMQGLADLTATTLLLVGYRRSRRKPNKLHPFGHGKEVYFWSVLSAFIMLAVTASLSFYFGYREFINPTPVDNLPLAYLILGVAVVTNAYAFWVGARKLLEGRSLRKLDKVYFESPMIAPKTAMVLDATGTLAALVGLAALVTYGITGDDHLDGLGGMMMSVVLAGFAVTLLMSARSLVTGQSASREIEHKIRDAVEKVPEVREVLGLHTMLLGSQETLVTIEINIYNRLTTDQIEQVIANVKKKVMAIQPGMQVHVEPDAR